PNVTTVGVVNVDQSLFSVDFRSAEQLYQLVTQVAGRAGRAQKKGTVYIQTAYPENECFRLIRTQNFDQFVQTTLSERRQAAYPPLSYMVLLRASSKDPDTAVQFLRKARATALNFKSNVKITDAVDSPLAKKSGRYRAQLSLISNSRKTLHTTLDQLIDELENDKTSRKVRWSVDVDPIDFY
ncbi:MAG: primosomal protein N', partial [Arenicellales bacterium WSBS_2016_MAG_OTU3]